MTLFVSGCQVKTTEDPQQQIEKVESGLIGEDYQFHFHYPGEDLVLGTSDDRFGTQDFYVPEHAVVQLQLDSRDFIYTIEIPDLDVYEAAVPNLPFEIRFTVGPAGSYELLGSQMCGYDHPGLLGKLIVQPVDQYKQSIHQLSHSPFQSK